VFLQDNGMVRNPEALLFAHAGYQLIRLTGAGR
jgi:hypothetical protein